MNKKDAIEKLEELKKRAETLIPKSSESQEFTKWHRDTQVALERIFGEDTYIKTFNQIDYIPELFTSDTPDDEFVRAYQDGLKNAIVILESFIKEINEYWEPELVSKKKAGEL